MARPGMHTEDTSCDYQGSCRRPVDRVPPAFLADRLWHCQKSGLPIRVRLYLTVRGYSGRNVSDPGETLPGRSGGEGGDWTLMSGSDGGRASRGDTKGDCLIWARRRVSPSSCQLRARRVRYRRTATTVEIATATANSATTTSSRVITGRHPVGQTPGSHRAERPAAAVASRPTTPCRRLR